MPHRNYGPRTRLSCQVRAATPGGFGREQWALRGLEADRIALIAPYLQHLTDTVIEYFEAEGVEVIDHHSLKCPDNLEVAQLDPRNLVSLSDDLDTHDADALVLSACDQMPSLQSIQTVGDRIDIPVLSVSVATVWDSLLALDLNLSVPNCGTLLSGDITNGSRSVELELLQNERRNSLTEYRIIDRYISSKPV